MATSQAFQYDDQTPLHWRSEMYAGSVGTGLLLVYNYNKLIPLKDITYAAFKVAAQGYDTQGAKWIPAEVLSFEQLQIDKCGEMPCISSCVKPGCICDRSKRKCIGL